MISPADLTMMQDAVAPLRSTACTITRGESTPATTTCRIRPDRREISVIPGTSLTPDVRWFIYLAPGTDILPGDQISALGCVYQVVLVKDPRTYEVSRQVVCYLIDDGSGTAPYLAPNATIAVSHQDPTSVVYTARRVRLVWPLPTDPIAPAGTRVSGYLYDVPDGTYLLGDIVTILAVDGHGAGLPAVDEMTVDLVQRLADGPPLVQVHITGENR